MHMIISKRRKLIKICHEVGGMALCYPLEHYITHYSLLVCI